MSCSEHNGTACVQTTVIIHGKFQAQEHVACQRQGHLWDWNPAGTSPVEKTLYKVENPSPWDGLTTRQDEYSVINCYQFNINCSLTFQSPKGNGSHT